MAIDHIRLAILDPKRTVERHLVHRQDRQFTERLKRPGWRVSHEDLHAPEGIRHLAGSRFLPDDVAVDGGEKIIFPLIGMYFRCPDLAVDPIVGGQGKDMLRAVPLFQVLAFINSQATQGLSVASFYVIGSVEVISLACLVRQDIRIPYGDFLQAFGLFFLPPHGEWRQCASEEQQAGDNSCFHVYSI